MDAGSEIIFETFVGRARTRVTFTSGEFDRWVQNIREDAALTAAIRRIQSGEEKLLDLDEGTAGIFPERIFPCLDQLQDKLTWLDRGTRHVVATFLLGAVLEAVGGKSKGGGTGPSPHSPQ